MFFDLCACAGRTRSSDQADIDLLDESLVLTEDDVIFEVDHLLGESYEEELKNANPWISDGAFASKVAKDEMTNTTRSTDGLYDEMKSHAHSTEWEEVRYLADDREHLGAKKENAHGEGFVESKWSTKKRRGSDQQTGQLTKDDDKKDEEVDRIEVTNVETKSPKIEEESVRAPPADESESINMAQAEKEEAIMREMSSTGISNFQQGASSDINSPNEDRSEEAMDNSTWKSWAPNVFNVGILRNITQENTKETPGQQTTNEPTPELERQAESYEETKEVPAQNTTNEAILEPERAEENDKESMEVPSQETSNEPIIESKRRDEEEEITEELGAKKEDARGHGFVDAKKRSKKRRTSDKGTGRLTKDDEEVDRIEVTNIETKSQKIEEESVQASPADESEAINMAQTEKEEAIMREMSSTGTTTSNFQQSASSDINVPKEATNVEEINNGTWKSWASNAFDVGILGNIIQEKPKETPAEKTTNEQIVDSEHRDKEEGVNDVNIFRF